VIRLAETCVRRPVFATMLVLVFVVLGAISYSRLGVSLFPDIDFPYTFISTVLKGASVEEIETRVTKQLEEAVNQVDGIEQLTSTSKEGVSQVLVGFVLERDGQEAAQDVRDKIAAALSQLPPEVEPPIIVRFDLDATPVMRIVVSGDRDLREVTEIARKTLKEGIETVQGVGAVTLLGGRERAVQVQVDADKLDAYGLSIGQVRRALTAQNVEIPGGRIDQGSRELVLRTMGRIERVRDFEQLVIGTLGQRPVTLGDVATVENGFVDPRSHSSLDGHAAVAIEVQKQSGANTVEVISRVKQRLKELATQLPPDLQFRIIKDESRFITRSIDEAEFHLLLGGILVAFTTLLFMGDFRSTLIAATSIPASVIATFTAMWMLDFTLNNMTLLALILSVGIVIDDAVVVLENIYRHVEEKGERPFDAALSATREIGLAVMATTMSLVVIFVPLAFMSGRSGRLFYQFGMTTAIAILFSMLISFTLTPMLCSRFLKRSGAGHRSAKERSFYRVLDRAYGSSLSFSLRHRWVIVLATILSIAATVPIFQALGKDFIPQDDTSEFEVFIQTPEGYTLDRSVAVFQEVADRIAKLRGVESTLATVGSSSSVRSGDEDVTRGGIYARLVDLSKRDYSQLDVMIDARKILAEYPELRSSVQAVNMFTSGSRSANFEFDLVGPDIDKLAELSAQLTNEMSQIPGFVDVDSSLALRKPEVRVIIDRQKAADQGIRVDEIAATLRTLVGGEPVSKYKELDEQYDVWLRASLLHRSDPRAIYDLGVARPDGKLVRLSSLVSLEEGRGPAEIERRDRQRQVMISANLDGMTLGDAVTNVQKIADRLDLPSGYSIRWSTHARDMAQAAGSFGLAFGLSAIFMYMILAAQFESFLHPIAIMLSLPLSIPFALLSLLLLGQSLNLYSVLGLFMLFGIIKKNGILQVDYTNTLRAEGMPRDEAILTANHVRLRPILMTTVMLVMGMIPIALGRGPGAASRASMAYVIIGGQTLCLLLTLLVTPVAYSLFDDAGRWMRTVGVGARLNALGSRLASLKPAWGNGNGRRPAS
jgi:hydrophobic/amphiphilic exporter-1 (mainly G- bacteria), HAE1 family